MGNKAARKVYRLFKGINLGKYCLSRTVCFGNCLLISTIFIAFTVLLFKYARDLARMMFKETTVRHLVLEILTTMELCAVCFELIVVADVWGVYMYGLYLFVLTVLWTKLWTDASACPYITMEEALEGGLDQNEAALRIFGQILGGLITYAYVQLFWAMELTDSYRGRAFAPCIADLQVSMMFGFGVELVGTCLSRLAARFMAEKNIKYSNVIGPFIDTTLVVLAFDFSGGYFNPALATSLKLGCKGNTFVEHVVVYWLGSFAGSLLAMQMYKSVKFRSILEKMHEA